MVVDAGNYYPYRDGKIEGIDSGLSDSEWVSSIVGKPVIKAFNNILAESLATKGNLEGKSARVAFSVAGEVIAISKAI